MSTATPFDVFDAPLEGVNLVEASAGTGKTWNICGIYLRLLLERRLEVRQILVVTFTKAATAELRERVRALIAEMLAYLRAAAPVSPDPFVATLARTLESRGFARDELVQRLDLALLTFDEAAIFTVHGWCQRALADTPFAAGMPFKVDVEENDAELRLDAVQDFWRRHVASDGCPAGLATWLAAHGDSPDTLAPLLARRLAKPLARIRWPAAIEEPVGPCLDQLESAYAAASTTWTAAKDDIAAIVSGSKALNAGTYKAKSIEAATAAWDVFVDAGDPLAAIEAKKLRLFATSCLREKTRKNQRAPAHRFFDQAESLLAARGKADAALARQRLRLVKLMFEEAASALRAHKHEQRVVSFDDVLFNLFSALGGDDEALARLLREHFPVALIDEFQDTDPIQFGIFKAVYGRGDAPLFLVGDPKQAIYAFRHADLHAYLKARTWASAEYTLGENQRSTPGLISAVNALFSANPRAFMLPGLDYRPVLPGGKRREVLCDDSAPRADFCVWTLPEYAGDACMPKSVARQRAAQATAAEIARLLDAASTGAITFGDAPLAAGHIAVLVRTHMEGSVVKEALAALGIASVELAHESVFRTPDAEDLARVLTAVLQPGQTSLLRGALATELLGYDANAIAAVSADETQLMVHLQRFLGYRELWLARGFGVMYRELLAAEGVNRRMLAREDGERRLTNLLHLGELLHVASQKHPSQDALLRWLDARRRDDAAVADAAQLRLESDRKLVQIVTIHKAKGLEYPLVFCPFVFDGYRHKRKLEGREYHDADGDAVLDFRDADELGDEDAAIREQISLEACAEDLRLLYVALTRASHRCYVVAGCYKSNRSSKEGCGSLLNWLVAGAGHAPDDWVRRGPSPTVIEHAWARFAADATPHVACSPLPQAPGAPLVVPQPSPETLRAATPPARIAAPWRIGSFSGLHDGAVSESAASDHDAHSDRPRAMPAAPPLAPDDILRFPRGTRAGECLHAALERADFTDDATWDDAIAYALRRHPVSLPGASPASLAPMMSRMIADVVRAELPGGIRLDAIEPERRLTELEFNLPAHGVTANALNALLRALGYEVDRLAFSRLDGYLKGYIDLVFEHRGRYYVADWKSNHLGYAAQDYDRPALAVAMAEHGYHLQSLLYCVALARYLARRVSGYRHDEHFGGVFYLFVRGVRPEWKGADAAATGVHFDRPKAATLARLDALLRPRSPQSGQRVAVSGADRATELTK